MKFISGGFAVWQFSVASALQSTVTVQMATRSRSDLDTLVVQVEGLNLEENKAGSGAYGCIFRVTVNGRDCIAIRSFITYCSKSNPLDRGRAL